MCFALINTSSQISEDRVAEGQWMSEIAKEGMEEFTESIQCDI